MNTKTTKVSDTSLSREEKKENNKKQKALLKKAEFVYSALQALYPDAECTLDTDEDPFRLFVRGILSAQCTDLRVNSVSKELFVQYPDIRAFAEADPEILGEQIRSCGLYRSKSKGIVESAHRILTEYGGVIPEDRDILQTFPAVGRKIANLIAGEIYGVPAIVVDTHCSRVAVRIGFSQASSPAAIEKDLMRYFPSEQWISLGHLMVAHGRALCDARNPKCSECPIAPMCDEISRPTASKKTNTRGAKT